MKKNWWKTGLVLAASMLLPITVSARVFISAPGPGDGTNYPGAPTTLYSINENGSNLVNMGKVTVNGTDVAVSAIALNSTGVLYGFIYDPAQGSQLVRINLTSLEGTPVGTGTFIAEQIVGAAFDRYNRLWVTDRNNTMNEFNITTLSYDGVPITLPRSDDKGGDLAFDRYGNCHYMGTHPSDMGFTTNQYSCDTDAGTIHYNGWSMIPRTFDAGHVAFSGLAPSLHLATCKPGLVLTAEGHAVTQVGMLELNVDSSGGYMHHVRNIGPTPSSFNHLDMAGFDSVAQIPQCDSCGDGILDNSEECDDGNVDPGDGCSEVCLFEYSPGCGNGVLDPNETCDDGNNLPGDGCPPSCMVDAPDADDDGIPDDEDNCPDVPNTNQSNVDGDEFGDACEPDNDDDGVIDDNDNCPLDQNADQANWDGDEFGDVCDMDADGDDVTDGEDVCLETVVGAPVLANGCSVDQECKCDAAWKNHGTYVRCNAHATEDLVEAGKMTEEEKDTIMAEAGESDCGHKK